MRRLMIALGALALLAAPAAAADLGDSSSPYQVNWTRAWAAIAGGYGMSNTAFSSGGTTFSGLGAEGVFAEAQAGFDRQFGNGLIGAFACAGYSDSRTTIGPMEIAENESYCAGARAGVVFGRSMLYVGGGWAWTNYEIGAFNDTANGPFGEVGYEYRFTKLLGGKIFGRYTDYDDPIGEPGLEIDPGRLQAGMGLTISLN